MHIRVVGSGYVGATVAACLAAPGHTAATVDIDERDDSHETAESRLTALGRSPGSRG